MIVFVGVFIGLQVDDWNEGRIDRLDEQVFQARLDDDILYAEELFGRLLERRFDRFEQLLIASDVLFGRTGDRGIYFLPDYDLGGIACADAPL